MEYTVPEDSIHNEYENSKLDSASVNFYNRSARNLNSSGQNKQLNRLNQRSNNTTLKSMRAQQGDGLFSLTFNSLLMNTRRFVSTVDAASFLNFPLNLESVEHNLRNSIIKKNSDFYR